MSGRVSWSHRLTAADMKKYTLKNILGGKDGWDPTIN
jgi:pectinesterase